MELPAPVPAADVDRVLAGILPRAGASRRATRQQVTAFRAYLGAGRLEFDVYAAGDGPEEAALAVIRLPGGVAVLMTAEGGSTARQAGLVRAWIAAFGGRFHYAQSFVEPDAAGRAAVLERSGFTRVTRMIYLERDVPARAAPESLPGLEWCCYAADVHHEFVSLLARTYADSSDCPEVNGLRSPEDALASHRAAGAFDPRRWELLQAGGRAVGCVLTAWLPHVRSAELVYMGVAADARGRGHGRKLLERALWHAAEAGASRLTLVVDERNAAARALYHRGGLRAFGTRDVYVLSLSGAGRIGDERGA